MPREYSSQYKGPDPTATSIIDEGLPPPMEDMETLPDVPDSGPLAPYVNDPNFDHQLMHEWITKNVHDKGLTVDMATQEIIDPDTHKVLGPVPMHQFYRRY